MDDEEVGTLLRQVADSLKGINESLEKILKMAEYEQGYLHGQRQHDARTDD